MTTIADGEHKDTSRSWVIVILSGMLMLLAMFDRQTLAILKTTICNDLKLTNIDYSILVSVFLTAYTFSYLLSGRLIDRFGPRIGGTACIVFLSVASMLPAFAANDTLLLVSRVLLGVASSAVMPLVTVAAAAWFSSGRRGLAIGVRSQIQAIGPVLAPPLVAAITLGFGWRKAFLLPGMTGIIFAGIWWRYCRLPHQRNGPKPVTFARVLQDPIIRAILVARMVTDPFWFFLVNWELAYLQERVGFTLTELGRVAWLPPALAAIAKLVACAASDRGSAGNASPITARMSTLVFVSLFSLGALFLPFTTNHILSLALLAVTYAVGDMWLGFSGLLVIETASFNAIGASIGIISFLSGIVSIAFSSISGYIVDRFGFAGCFVYGAVIYPITGITLMVYFKRRTRISVPVILDPTFSHAGRVGA
jgi:MFS transporter, ACS family, hexuronate transporter